MHHPNTRVLFKAGPSQCGTRNSCAHLISDHVDNSSCFDRWKFESQSCYCSHITAHSGNAPGSRHGLKPKSLSWFIHCATASSSHVYCFPDVQNVKDTMFWQCPGVQSLYPDIVGEHRTRHHEAHCSLLSHFRDSSRGHDLVQSFNALGWTCGPSHYIQALPACFPIPHTSLGFHI
jgi:hypothetical protein